jgi:hypothetical protein
LHFCTSKASTASKASSLEGKQPPAGPSILRQHLHFCTSKASKASISKASKGSTGDCLPVGTSKASKASTSKASKGSTGDCLPVGPCPEAGAESGASTSKASVVKLVKAVQTACLLARVPRLSRRAELVLVKLV